MHIYSVCLKFQLAVIYRHIYIHITSTTSELV